MISKFKKIDPTSVSYTHLQYAGQEGCAGSFGVQCFWGYLGVMPFQACNYGGFKMCIRDRY